jgi:hypothetical protein
MYQRSLRTPGALPVVRMWLGARVTCRQQVDRPTPAGHLTL